ncbi:MAG: hypothetical protein KDD38_09775 [Bdellovibrionales bacterium]|nr:hypothetical protein [Bdellovibrionales bacterium]
MKYVLSILAGMVIMSPAAFAGDDLSDLKSVNEIEKEESIMDFLGVVSSFDRGHGRDRYRRPPRPGYPPPRHRYPPARPGYPDRPHHGYYVCYAENARGQNFVGRDYSARRAQQEALDVCYSYSRRCRSLGCRHY